MNKEVFLDKLYCDYAVKTFDTNCHIVTKELGINPTRFFNKGDKFTSQYSPSIGYESYGLWVIELEPIVTDDLNVSQAIKYFQDLFQDKMEIIKKLRYEYKFETSFSIDIKTEDAGIGIDLYEEDLAFINKIASRFSCSFIAVENL